MRVVTYNLRYDSQPDKITVQQSLDALQDPLQQPSFLQHSGRELPWSTRRIRVAQHLLGEGISIASFQEALVRQVKDLAELFGPEWSWIGVGRDDGQERGEYCPIFFKNKSVKLLSKDFFWLSNNPFEPSKFPDAGSYRVCTAAYFSIIHGDTEKCFTLLNTHLDDQSDAQRKLGASMLLIRAHFEAFRTGHPVIITGDFNSPSSGKDSGAYKILTGVAQPVPVNSDFAAKYAVGDDQLPGFKMLDLRSEAPRRNVSANYATFTGFTKPHDASSWSRIDFIFGGNNGGWTAESHHVGTNLADDGVLESDHRPVFADISI